MTEHDTVTAIETLAARLLDETRDHRSRRAARTVVSRDSMRATVIALGGGADLAEHDSPPAGTLHVLTGSVLLRTPSRQWQLDSGDLVSIPPERHSVHAITDAAMLLTVALH